MPVLKPSGSDFTALVKTAAQYVPAGRGGKVSKSGRGEMLAPLSLGAIARASLVAIRANPGSSVLSIPYIIPRTAGGGAAPPPTFLPTSISGCALWLDGADVASTTMSGNNITVWNDKSGNGYNGTVDGTVGTSTINGVRAVAFTGVSSSGSFRGNLPYTGPTLSIFSVCTMASLGGARLFAFGRAGAFDYAAPGTGFFGCYYTSVSDVAFAGYKNTDYTAKSSVITLGTPYITSFIWDGTNANINLNGGSINSLAQTGGGFTISNYAIANNTVGYGNDASIWSGNIGELLVFSNALTSTQRQSVEGYLAWKWGQQASLPGDHLYKTAAPPP